MSHTTLSYSCHFPTAPENLVCIKLNERPQKVEDRLRELGELKILEEFKKGTFAI